MVAAKLSASARQATEEGDRERPVAIQGTPDYVDVGGQTQKRPKHGKDSPPTPLLILQQASAPNCSLGADSVIPAPKPKPWSMPFLGASSQEPFAYQCIY